MSEWMEFILVLLMMGSITYAILVLLPRWIHQQVKQTAQQIAQKLHMNYVTEEFEPEPELEQFFTHWAERHFTHRLRGTSPQGQPYELFYIRYVTKRASTTGRPRKKIAGYPICVLAIPHNPQKCPMPEFQLIPITVTTISNLFKDLYHGEPNSSAYKIAHQGFELYFSSPEAETFFDQLPAEVWQTITPSQTVVRLEGSWLIWYEMSQNSADSTIDMVQRGLTFYETLSQHSPNKR